MPSPLHAAVIDRWVDAFLATAAPSRFPRVLTARAGPVLRAFLAAACARADAAPSDLDARDAKTGLWTGTLPLDLPPAARRRAPALCAALLRWAGDRGGLADAARTADYLERLAPAYREAAGLRDAPPAGASAFRPAKGARRPPRADGRQRPNEPCVCGSGRKFKKCCGRGAGDGEP